MRGSPILTNPLTSDYIPQKQHSLKCKMILLLQWTLVRLLHSHCWTSQLYIDTIDHNIIFDCLREWFGVDGTVLLWIKSYLTNHKQKVIASQLPSQSPMEYPRALSWVLSFLLFTLPPLSDIIYSFNVTNHLYADDTQIYLAPDHRNFDSSFAELTECLNCVQKWMDSVKLKLNPEKTEFIIIGDRQAREFLVQNFPIQLLGNCTPLLIQSRTKVLLSRL